MIQRTLTETVVQNFKPGFITLIYGPRRVGKTVLLKQLVNKLVNKIVQTDEEKVLWFNGDTEETRSSLSTTSQTKLANLVKDKSIIVIDEAQRIENIALSLKILIDSFPKKKIIVTGSSSLMLARGLQETLTGRTTVFKLYPLSTNELTQGLDAHQKPQMLDSQLTLGGYPYLTQISSQEKKQRYLKSIVSDYLFKDVLLLKDVSSPETLKKLAILLAFQIGNEVSLNELAGNLGIDVKTVKRYLSLLKQSFVIFELSAFSKNLRKEVAKSKKYYFWDLGIRNALIDQFMPLDSRTDVGQLWENFLAIERLKKHEYVQTQSSYHFWRTYEKAEIDWIEIEGGKLAVFEFKWKSQKAKTPKAFKEAYHENVRVVSRENYLEFVT
ncbi:ATP-binding protein [Patescibacteria group bacterium]|nr:ATP-binding protein [Patescibacteria group bacterium]